MSDKTVWESESKSLTAAATKGKVVSERYRVTEDYVYVSMGVISSKAEQYPLWALRDIDVSSSMIQKARGLSDVKLRFEANDYTGKADAVFRNIEGGSDLRSILNKLANEARLLRQQQSQTMHYSGAAPIANAPSSSASVDPIEQLTKLGSLLQAGLITQEEFDSQKAKLLG